MLQEHNGRHIHENHGNKHNKSVASAEIVLLLAGIQAIYTSLRAIPELEGDGRHLNVVWSD